MKEPTKDELKKLILELFETIQGYQGGHNGRTEPFECDCRFCKRVGEIIERISVLSSRTNR